jgi:hypothetical protein
MNAFQIGHPMVGDEVPIAKVFREHIRKPLAACASMMLLAALIICGSLLASRPAGAEGGMAAAGVASAGLGACSSNSGKALYSCVAGVLDTLSNEISGAEETQRSLKTAASRLRAAVNKVQALSAITQCQAVVAGALRQALGSGRNGKGLSAIAGVLAQAARLIQSKG